MSVLAVPVSSLSGTAAFVVAGLSLLLALLVVAVRRPDSAALAAALVCVALWCVSVARTDPWSPDFVWWSAWWLPAVAGWCGAMVVLARRMAVPGWRPSRVLAALLVAVPVLVLALDLGLHRLELFGGWRQVGGTRELYVGPGWFVVTGYDVVLIGAAAYFLLTRLAGSTGPARWITGGVLALLGATAVSQAAPDGTDATHHFAAAATLVLGYGIVRERLTEPTTRWRGSLEAARVDPVTGCLDRASLDLALAEAILAAERSGEQLSLALLDLDDLKTINDGYGHLIGDRVLRGVAELVGDALGDECVLGRFGGDEFVVLLPGVATAQAGRTVVEVQRAARRPIALPNGESVVATFSVGVATHVPGQSREALLGAADRAMYEAKRAGGDRHAIAG